MIHHKNKSCPLCKAQATILNKFSLLELTESETLNCRECGLIFRSPLPAADILAKYYQANYFRYPDKVQESMAKIQGDWIANKLCLTDINLSKINYIEFGAGRGYLVDYMRKHGFRSSVGFEPDHDSVRYGRDKFQIDLRSGFLNEGLLDAISDEFVGSEKTLLSFVHVLEHLHTPAETIADLGKHFPEGYIFIEVPDGRYEGPVMALDTFPKSSMGQHFWSFTQDSLERLLRNAGYSVIVVESHGSSQFWTYELMKLNTWSKLSTMVKRWEATSFNLRDGVINLTLLLFDLIPEILKNRLKKIFYRNNQSRLDLPVLRMLAVRDMDKK